MKSKVKKAVFPVAGYGTRFLPATKSIPKEMFPIVNIPLIQYCVNEAIEAGITQLVFIVSYGKKAIENYFDSNIELETKLKKSNKHSMLNSIQHTIPDNVECIFLQQRAPDGLGSAVSMISSILSDDESFLVILPDELFDYKQSNPSKQLIEHHSLTNSSVIGIKQVAKKEVSNYGIVDIKKVNDNLSILKQIIEKPDIKEAPSNYAAIGRYVLNSNVIKILSTCEKSVGNEIQLTDAIAKLVEQEFVYTTTIDSPRFDCGSSLGFLDAILHFYLQDKSINKACREIIKKHLQQ